MKKFHQEETLCEMAFRRMGECYHLWTPENHEIIFTDSTDFRAGMNIMGICARLHTGIRILTFEIMSNHIHITASSGKEELLLMFKDFAKMLGKWRQAANKATDLTGFQASVRSLETLEDIRNVIVYDNRNGFIVTPEATPFSYPWGANRYYYSPDSCKLAQLGGKKIGLRARRLISHSRIADNVEGLMSYEDCALPLSFCDIRAGESLFRNASHYFNKLSRNIESNGMIAKEIGESIWYTDDELFAHIRKICREKYNVASPALLSQTAKLELAKTLSYDFHAGAKQIRRILRLDSSVLSALGIMSAN